jgi:hypothetical protein
MNSKVINDKFCIEMRLEIKDSPIPYKQMKERFDRIYDRINQKKCLQVLIE